MTATPMTKPPIFPSRETESPSASPISANTKHATGTENFCSIMMISGCGESAGARSA